MRRSRVRWWTLGLLLLILVVGGVSVSVSRHLIGHEYDRAELLAEAEAQGLPITAAECWLPIANPERRSTWDDLVDLSCRLPAYYHHHLRHPQLPPSPHLAPIPHELMTYHAHLDSGDLARMGVLLDRLGPAGMVVDTDPELASLTVSRSVDICLLWQERVRIAPVAEVERECRRLLTVARACSAGVDQQLFIYVSQPMMAIEAIVDRLPDLRSPTSALATDLDALSEELLALGRTLPTANLRYVLDHLDVFTPRTGAAMGSTASVWQSLTDDPRRAADRISFLLGRTQVLEYLLRSAVACRAVQEPAARVSLTRRLSAELSRVQGLAGMGAMAVDVLGRTAPNIQEHLLRSALFARLVAAELRGQPWPVDWCDAGGARIRPLREQGTLVGGYSVGTDGRDDGGVPARDWVWLLYPRPAPP